MGEDQIGVHQYDLVAIGSGPAGQKAAIAAAKLGKRVAIVDRPLSLGGVSLHTGTIPSKSLREAILYLSGYRQRAFYGRGYKLKSRITMADLMFRVDEVIRRELEVVRSQLLRNRIDVIEGEGRFHDPHTIEVCNGDQTTLLPAAHILIACGTRPAHSKLIALDGTTTIDSDQLLQRHGDGTMDSAIVVGAGVVGLEYASMFSALDVKVTIIDARPTLLEFVDQEILESLLFQMRRGEAVFRLGEEVTAVDRLADGRVCTHLASGKKVTAHGLLYTVGRQGNTDSLALEKAGLTTDARGRIAVNERFQTAVPHIYAAGDVIGFPSLASASFEQGRLAACAMFGVEFSSAPHLIPYGIYTIPEISMVGKTEQQLTAEKVPYEIGVARFEELAKGQMIGDDTGMLKLLFDPETTRLLGVHVIGEGAVELIHIGQAVLAFGGSVTYFRDAVFNYPTLAEAYKVAAMEGLNKL
jgi:NAD(P) transhydrogenase